MLQKICEECSKEFEIGDSGKYQYKTKYRGNYRYYCSYTCLRKKLCVVCKKPAVKEYSYVKNTFNSSTEYNCCSHTCYKKAKERFS